MGEALSDVALEHEICWIQVAHRLMTSSSLSYAHSGRWASIGHVFLCDGCWIFRIQIDAIWRDKYTGTTGWILARSIPLVCSFNLLFQCITMAFQEIYKIVPDCSWKFYNVPESYRRFLIVSDVIGIGFRPYGKLSRDCSRVLASHNIIR